MQGSQPFWAYLAIGPRGGRILGSAYYRSLRDKDAAVLENAATLQGYSPPRARVNQSTMRKPASVFQFFQ
jgi:hypothetical protein